MPTHAIGAGTANLSVNVPQSAHRFLGRQAFLHNLSMGAFVRWMLERARWVTKDAAEAEQADREALMLLREAGRDGWTDGDAPAIEQAMRLIAESAEKDGKLSRP